MIELQDVHKTYDTGTKALNGISMKIDDGEFVFLVGPSGSGKSTIIKILTAELRPTSGSALVNGFAVEKLRGRAVPYLRRTLGVIFQDFRLISDKSVYENLPGCVPALLGIASADRCAGSRADALLASAVPAFAAKGAATCFVAPLQAALRATRASNKPCCNSQQVL